MTEMDTTSSKYGEVETAWRTIDIISVSGTPHAYQQRVSVRMYKARVKKKDKPYATLGSDTYEAEGTTRVEEDEHRLVPMHETMDDAEFLDLIDEGTCND